MLMIARVVVASLAFATLAAAQTLLVRSAASYGETVAPGSSAVLFGVDLAIEPAVGAVGRNLQVPRTLSGVRVEIAGLPAGLAYVSPSQINLVVPRRSPEGEQLVILYRNDVEEARGTVRVARVAPGLFSLDGSGAGRALALNAATYARGPFGSHTAEAAGCDKRTRVTLLSTGIREADALQVTTSLVSETAGMVEAPVESVRASEKYAGVDEVTILLPEGVDGELDVRLEAASVEANKATIEVVPTVVPSPDCAELGSAFVYNTVADLLGGDLWDTVSPTDVFADLGRLSGDWIISGAGTTALEARNGELIATGTAGSSELVWSDPHFPPTVRSLSAEPIAFLAVGAGNPASVVVAEADPARPIHEQVSALARSHGVAFASIRVLGRFSQVSYSVAHNLLKQGTPLTDPAVAKAPFQLFFETDVPAEWELSGLYAAAVNVQGVGVRTGGPGSPARLPARPFARRTRRRSNSRGGRDPALSARCSSRS